MHDAFVAVNAATITPLMFTLTLTLNHNPEDVTKPNRNPTDPTNPNGLTTINPILPLQ